MPRPDPTSFSNFTEVTTSHIDLNLKIDFSKKIICGHADLHMKSLTSDLTQINLDILSLSIKSIHFLENQVESSPLQFKILEKNEIGENLNILLVKKLEAKSNFVLRIYYFSLEPTSNGLSGLNWLEPKLTLGKKFPYLFTQGEPIYARSIAPMQDHPSVKVTYDAVVEIEEELNVFMSGTLITSKKENGKRINCFKQKIEIPTYLIAIVAGNLSRKEINSRCGVISEPESLDFYAKELEDINIFIEKLENYLFKYYFDDYNIVILPPSFPYGGMENPQLTFANPTIITGDKSNISVAIHEIAHSWSGNLMTCRNWSSFWLNEGITVFLERKICLELYGKEIYSLECVLGDIHMKEAIKNFGSEHNYTSLKPIFKINDNPDDAFSSIPYEKGFQLLKFLEDLIGEQDFKLFLTAFLQKYAKKNCDTDNFIIDFEEFTISINKESTLKNINWKDWIEKPGLPPVDFNIQPPEDYRKIDERAKKFIETIEVTKENVEFYLKYDFRVKQAFLNYLYCNYDHIEKEKLLKFGEANNLQNEKNCEVLGVWLKLCVKNKVEEIYDKVMLFLEKVGRMKFIMPIYRELKKVDFKLGRDLYLERKEIYHPIANNLLDKLFEIKNE